MKIGTLVRTGKGMYAYEGVLAIVVSIQAPKAVIVRVLSQSESMQYANQHCDGDVQVGDLIHVRDFDYDDLEVISESR